jgi:uncharacterized protein DUF6644
LHPFLAWLEGSLIGHAMRESGVWIYGVVNLFHILSIASLFGSILLLDLRLFGVWRSVPLAAISTPCVPVATVGFVVATLTGIGLLATKATEYQSNPFFYIKIPAIILGLINVAALSALPAWKQHRTRELSAAEQSKLSVYGGISLACWFIAIAAGRMIGYW